MTIRCLLLPLDGSDLAENALPAGVYFASLFSASITLFHVIEKRATGRIHASRHLIHAGEAETYLKETAARLIPGGPRDWLIGNIAQQVISRGSIPVLLLRPAQPPAPGASFSCRSILLPMDGVPEHERSAALAEEIAQRSGAAMHLATVVPTPETLSGEKAATGRLLPGSTAALLDLTEDGAENYLQRNRERLQSTGIKTTAQVLRGDPAAELAKLANGRRDDLIVLGTHGKAGSSAFWNRSVAARVLGKIKIPALLIPVR
jgi:nucleotide-binding universal stress UspA family protein